MSSINYPERRSRVAILVCLLGLLTILAQVFLHLTTVNAGAQPPLTAQQPSIMPIADLSVKGHLAPSDSIEIAMAEGSRAEQVRVAEGQKVSAGQTLLRLDTYSERAAEVAAAELDEVEAQQRLDDLYRTADVALAEAGVALALADKEQKYARDYLVSLQNSKSQAQVDQAYANLLLRQRQLKLAKDDLQKAENKYANEDNIIWMFITKHAFKLRLVDLRKNVTSKERHLEDAQDKYDKLLEPVDPIDLAQAQARLELANARLDKARQDWEKLHGGPDPDELTAAQANLRLAQAQLQAARVALAATEIVAPASGEVVEVAVKPGEWIRTGSGSDQDR